MSPPSPLILLVGMHRSGTSLLGSLLEDIGVALPGRLIPADDHNPEGYYERDDVTGLDERLLIELGRWWPSAGGHLPLGEGWLSLPSSRRTALQLQELLQREARCQNGPWAIKDPRIGGLLPLWRGVAESCGLPLRLLLGVRDPAEVMVSLVTRDSSPAGMTPWHAQRLIWRHLRQILLEGGDLPLLVAAYEHWFDRKRALRQLEHLQSYCLQGRDAVCPGRDGNDLRRALERIRPDHRRSLRRPVDLPLPIHPLLDRVHQRLAGLALQPPDSQNTGLDSLRHWLRNDAPEQLPASPHHIRPLPARFVRRLLVSPPRHEVGPWFCPEHYARQCPRPPLGLDPLSHYLWRGWRHGLSPHPWFEPRHYRQACSDRGIHLHEPPLLHYLREGIALGLGPGSIADPVWTAAAPQRRELARAARLEGLHPWGGAALALCGGDAAAATDRLHQWLVRGPGGDELELLAALAPTVLALVEEAHPIPAPLPGDVKLLCIGTHPADWQLHAWLQHLPVGGGQTLGSITAEDGSGVGINLLPLPTGAAGLQLLELARLPVVFDPDPDRVVLLRRLGVNARLLQPTARGNGWLGRPLDPGAVGARLGLPPPASLRPAAAQGGTACSPPAALCLGPADPVLESPPGDGLWHWPGFEAVILPDSESARLLASWLDGCSRAGLQLVRLNPSWNEQRTLAWRALVPPPEPPEEWLPPQAFINPITAEELRAELCWRHQGQPPPPPAVTPRPAHRVLWRHEAGPPPRAAVCISLYDYAGSIATALDSVAAQDFAALELIVVDDASRDDGAGIVVEWLQRHGDRFHRALLLQHASNGGLAAARNTAFRVSRSPWCFVLDADNVLRPDALASCLAVATQATAEVAVVHPLVEVVAADAAACRSGLISDLPWQRQQFLQRNYIDAMALIRREAWERVGGYTHIPGGWEDYDFWCTLIDAGYHGLLCPRTLATYHRHGRSMLSRQTARRLRSISRLLQHRHPWLKLSTARGAEEGWA